MTPHDDLILTAEQSRARDEVRALRGPAADPAFRARLRQSFVEGTVAAPARRTTRILTGPFQPVAPWRWALVPAAAAALLIAVSVMNRGPDWSVVHAGGEGVVIVDRRPIPVAHVTEQLASLLRPGAMIELGDAVELELAIPGGAVMQITPGTQLTLPRSPGRWYERVQPFEVRNGEIRLTTGPRFHGARFEVATPEAAVEIVGTTLAVIREPAGTCVCVYEGTVRVGPRGQTPMPVEHGMRRFVFNDGREPELAAIRPIEGVKLAEFREQRRAMLEEPK
jgi:hypothetical protein